MAEAPKSGPRGVARSTGEIMAQERSQAGKPRPIRMHPEHEVEGREENPQHPNALPANSYPVRSAAIQGSLTGPIPRAPQTAGTTFTAATLADTSSFPPDTQGCVGPSQFLLASNGRVRSFTKAGVQDNVLNADTDVFFNSVMTPPASNNFTSDPHVRYDRLTKRWYVIIIDVPNKDGTLPNRILLAVSDAASNGVITGSTVWTYYYIAVSANFADYPTLGYDNNALYIGTNMFSTSGPFVSTNAYVIRKSSILSGGPIVYTEFINLINTSTNEGPYTPQGVDNPDPASTFGYFIGVSNARFGELILKRVSNPDTTPTLSADLAVTVNATRFPITVPHLGNSGGNNGKLDALDDRLFAAAMRNGSIWTCHNVGVNSTGVSPGTGNPTRNAVRWYQVTNVSGTPTLAQSGTIYDSTATNPLFYWIPTIMVSGQGHAALGFSVAGNNARINAVTAGRLSGDVSGTMQTPFVYTNSQTAYNPASDPGGTTGRRWGDYSYTSLDPNDDMTMYTIQEFCDATNSYGVNVAKLIAPPPATPLSCLPASVALNTANTTVTVTGTQLSGSGFYDPGAGFANRIAGAVGGGVTVNAIQYVNPTTVQLGISTVGASQGLQSVTITNPDGQSRSGNILTIGSPVPVHLTDFEVAAK